MKVEHRSRFESPSSSLNLRDLLSATRGILILSFVLALVFHLSLTQINISRDERSAVRPLAMRFVKREPRLTKPLELRKSPRPRRRTMKRKITPAKVKPGRAYVSSSHQPMKVLDSLAKPKAGVSVGVRFTSVGIEPGMAAVIIESTKEPEDRIDMSLEMVDIDALDTGRYQAMIVQDPRDKKRIRGFFHLAIAYSESIRMIDVYQSSYEQSVINLTRALNKFTGIKADVTGRVTFDSQELLKVPWIYCSTGHAFSFKESEAIGLGRYMLSGGFVFTDDANAYRGGPGDRSLREMVAYSLETQGIKHGRDWRFERIPNDHPMYHCYYEFDSGPPIGADFVNTTSGWGRDADPYNYVDGVQFDGRLLAIMANKGMWGPWGYWGPGAASKGRSDTEGFDNTRQLQFGINTIIFALTQEGSITKQVMNYIE